MYNIDMSKFIIAAAIVLLVCGYLAYNLYREMSAILDAKRIQEQFKKDSFWETQESFEE
jgi:hypothetical protein